MEYNIYVSRKGDKMKILAIGDIVGRTGRKAVKEILPKLKKEYNIDFVVANVENASGGLGLTINGYDDLYMSGIDIMTMGNHTWAKREIFQIFNDKNNIIRPANYSNRVPGLGYITTEVNGKKILVINLIGRVQTGVSCDCPFTKAEHILQKVEHDIAIIDFHAEATAEKIALGYYLKDKANIIYGTHTHVQTADERIFDSGMGYITDIGMTGPKESVLGMKVEIAIKRFVTQIPEKYSVADGEYIFNGAIFDIDDRTNKVIDIKRINM